MHYVQCITKRTKPEVGHESLVRLPNVVDGGVVREFAPLSETAAKNRPVEGTGKEIRFDENHTE
jgi:hypothetical protein